MTQAAAYNRTKNFLENSPDRTDHGSLNSELDNVAVSINALRSNAALLQNDDGTLKNAIVTLANLAAEVVTGLTGPIGPDGPVGPVGPDGPVGSQGPKGDTGASFDADVRDVFGNIGLYNLQPKGFSFLALDTGALYFKLSNTSADWSAGVPYGKGETGATGATGAQGAQGLQGPQGIQGLQGLTGANGADGADGLVVSVDSATKTASLIGRSSVNANLKMVGNQLTLVLTTS